MLNSSLLIVEPSNESPVKFFPSYFSIFRLDIGLPLSPIYSSFVFICIICLLEGLNKCINNSITLGFGRCRCQDNLVDIQFWTENVRKQFVCIVNIYLYFLLTLIKTRETVNSDFGGTI